MKEHRPILQYLIISLIYPAVLGTIMYGLIDSTHDHLSCTMLLNTACSLKRICKIILVLFVLLFYVCDFLYTTYSSEFKWLYFIEEILILVGLYTIFKNIDYNSKSLSESNMKLILWLFIIFMVLYFIWDYNEYRSSDKGSVEGFFYCDVLKWEKRSLVLLSLLQLCLYFCHFNTEKFEYWITFLVIIITAEFVCLVKRKWQIQENKKVELALKERNAIISGIQKLNKPE